MNPLKEFFESGQTILWIETENTVTFLRPVPDILVWTPCPASRLAEFLRLGKIGLALTQLLLRALAVGDIPYSADQFDKLPVLLDTVSNRVQEFHRAVRHYQPMLEINLFAFRGPVKGLLPHLKVVRMDSVTNQFVCRFDRGVETADAISFLGPSQLACSTIIPTKTAGLAESLRFRQICFPPPELRSQFFLLGDVHQSADKPSNDSVFPDRHANAADHPLHAVGPDNALLEITPFTSRNHTLDRCLNNCAILWMYPCEIVGNGRNSVLGVESENLV